MDWRNRSSAGGGGGGRLARSLDPLLAGSPLYCRLISRFITFGKYLCAGPLSKNPEFRRSSLLDSGGKISLTLGLTEGEGIALTLLLLVAINWGSSLIGC